MTGACLHCGKPIPASRSGRPPRYCSSACRVAAFRKASADDATPVGKSSSAVTKLGHGRPTRSSVAGVPVCPEAPQHGALYAWRSERWGWWCAHSGHGGNGRFFTTAELEAPSGRPDDAHEVDLGVGERAGTASGWTEAAGGGTDPASLVIPPAGEAGDSLELGL